MGMQTRRVWGFVGLVLVAALFVVTPFASGRVFAQSASNNYQMVESQFGNTTSNESCSDNYCASVSIGNDSQASSATAPEFGKANYSEPLLEMIVISGDSNLGELTTEKTGTKIMQVKIRNYLTGGYRLQILGDAPKYQNHVLATPSSPVASQPGTEQFGINAVENSTPDVGATPVLQPDEGNGTGLVLANYKIANQFMYVSGQTIAETAENTGGADYTVSMIVNISNETPAGKYSGDFAAVVMPYF
jgi:hypothetical protein